MHERLRLDYLNVMGITQYVARSPLPGALPSPIIDDIASNDSNALSTIIEEPSSNTLTHIAELLGSTTATLQAAPAPLSATQQHSNPTASISTNAAILFHCQIAFWTIDDLLVLAEAPRLDNPQLTLLRNILNAIGRKEQLPNAGQFSWPLPQRKDKTLAAAQEHFQGLLDGGALQHGSRVRQILCFGEQIPMLLQEQSHTQQYRDWPLITVCTLQDMLTQPARKSDTWRTLQVLIRA